MKKTIFSIALMALMIFMTSAFNNDNAGTREGDFAPALKVENDSVVADLSQMRGEYVLLSFWSSADAASRVECNKYAAWVKTNKPQGLRHISVNFDQQPLLFEEVAKRDGMDLSAQFNVHGHDAEKIIDDFSLAEGFGTMLIGPDGRIAQINPSTIELSSLL